MTSHVEIGGAYGVVGSDVREENAFLTLLGRKHWILCGMDLVAGLLETPVFHIIFELAHLMVVHRSHLVEPVTRVPLEHLLIPNPHTYQLISIFLRHSQISIRIFLRHHDRIRSLSKRVF